MSKKSTEIIHPRVVERCEICGDTIPHRYRGCIRKRNSFSTDVENKTEYQHLSSEDRFPKNQNIRYYK